MRSQVIKLYQPWPVPVLAARYSSASVLAEIAQWVADLRDRGLVDEDVRFSVSWRPGWPVGVLHDHGGTHELPPNGYLVFGERGFQVLDDRTFFGQYHDPDQGRP